MNLPRLSRVLILLLILFFICEFSLAATFPLTTTPNGSGSITRNPESALYPEGGVVTLTAVPSAGWHFTSWSGDITGTLNPTNVLMNSSKTIIANFSETPSYSLTLNISGSGSVNPSTGSYLSNTVVSITATPSMGWIFHHWTGDASGTANPLDFALRSNRVITAVFVQPPSFFVEPTNYTASPGTMATFRVGALGSKPLEFNWYFNEVLIASAHDTILDLTNVQISNAGGYHVVISNPYGSATSRVALLTVTCPGTNVVSVPSEAALKAAVSAGGLVHFCVNGTIDVTETIVIEKDVALDATGVSMVLNGRSAVRLFRVHPGVQFVLTNLVLINGRHVGTNGAASQDGETAAGAGILNNEGSVVLASCTLSNHSVVGGNGGNGTQASPTAGNAGRALGAAIYNTSGTCLIVDTLCVSNSAMPGIPGVGSNEPGRSIGRGGALYATNSTLIAINSSLIGNTVFCRPVSGAQPRALGGAACADSSVLSMTNVSLLGNSSIGQSDTGGALTAPAAFGGAIALILGEARLDRINVASNMAMGGYARLSSAGEGLGGGLYLNGQVALRASTIFANRAIGGGGQNAHAGQGGGVYNLGELEISGCTIHGNAAQGGSGRTFVFGGFPGADAGGGGIWDGGGFSRITNSTITANSSQGGSAMGFDAAAGTGVGGGVGSSQTFLMNVTLASNSVAGGGGGGGGVPGLALGANIFSGAAATMQNSILAGASNNLAGTITDAGYNISSDGSAGFASGTSFNFTDPKLLPLADNGGPTLTMALAAGSPAIDWVQAAGFPPTDQRGVPRPLGSAADVGAFESGAERAALTLVRKFDGLELSFPVTAGVPYQIQHAATLTSSWQLYESLGTVTTNGIVTRMLPVAPGSHFFRVTTY